MRRTRTRSRCDCSPDAGLRALTDNAAAGRVFGVSRQAFSKWLQKGVPAERTPALADLAAATDILDSRVKRERIPAVVRRGAEILGGESLYELACKGRHNEVMEMVRMLFDLRRIQP